MSDKKISAPYFIASIFVALLTAMMVIPIWIPFFFAEAESLSHMRTADNAGRMFGAGFVSFVFCAIGFSASMFLYRKAMARQFPSTHSDTGTLQLIHEATKSMKITESSEDGFYANATTSELFDFYNQLVESGVSPRLNALILEVRRRLGVE